jgi:hypothetical protein
LSAPSIAYDGCDAARTFHVIHPFHPLCGRQLSLVTIRSNWGEDRAYYRDGQQRLACVPASWTDAVPADPVVAVSAGRSPFRLEDLLELTRLVAEFGKEMPHDR